MITDSWQKLPVTSVKEFCVGSPAFDLQQASKCPTLLHLLQVALYALHLISLTSLLGFLPWLVLLHQPHLPSGVLSNTILR